MFASSFNPLPIAKHLDSSPPLFFFAYLNNVTINIFVLLHVMISLVSFPDIFLDWLESKVMNIFEALMGYVNFPPEKCHFSAPS